jgi:hypothetical protein
MAEQALKGHPDIFLTIRRSAQARRITLRISQLDGRVSLTLPKDITEVVAIEFAQQKAPWIRKHLECRLQNVFVGIGKEIPISGRMRWEGLFNLKMNAFTCRGMRPQFQGKSWAISKCLQGIGWLLQVIIMPVNLDIHILELVYGILGLAGVLVLPPAV